MFIDLREIIGVPGCEVSFDFEPDLTGAIGGSIVNVEQPTRAAGNVKNSAGVLTFSATIDAKCKCICARCLKEFELPVHKHIAVNLTEEGEGENPDGYFIEGDKINAGEVVFTEFMLDMDDRQLCSQDCPGLCQKCGVDLNFEQCKCEKEIDPRLAVLSQLLNIENIE